MLSEQTPIRTESALYLAGEPPLLSAEAIRSLFGPVKVDAIVPAVSQHFKQAL